jgi:hypothetical protein
MSYTSKFEQPSSYQPQSWPPRPHARFAHIPQGLAVLARITTWHDTSSVVAAPTILAACDNVPTPPVVSPAPSIAPELNSADLIAPEELPATAAFLEQELQPATLKAVNNANVEVELAIEPGEVAAQLGQAPQYQTAIREAVQKRAKALRTKKTLVTQWHLLGNDQVLNHLPSLHLWALAGCWGQTRQEKLVVIDATNHGPELAQVLSWDCAAGWNDLLAARATLSETMHATPWPNVTFIPRGGSTPEFYEETCLRQASALGALQRDYRAVWILTAGAWDEAAQVTSQQVRERQLIVPLNCPANTWYELNAKLAAGNVLVNGWVALGAAAEPLPCAA